MDGWIDRYVSNMAHIKQIGRDTRNRVPKVWKNMMNSLVSRGYNFGLINIDDLSADSSTIPSKKGEGQK